MPYDSPTVSKGLSTPNDDFLERHEGGGGQSGGGRRGLRRGVFLEGSDLCGSKRAIALFRKLENTSK